MRPEKVTTASLAATSAPAFLAAAWTMAASFLSSARGVMVPDSSARSTIAGANVVGSSVKVLPFEVTWTGPDTATSANSLRTRASSSALTLGAAATAATSTVRSPGHHRRTASAVPGMSVVVPVTGFLTVTLPLATEIAPSTGSASSSPRASSTAAANTSSSTVTAAGCADPPDRCAHIVAGESEKPTRASTVASTSTPRPSSFGRFSTLPALEVSTSGCVVLAPSSSVSVALASSAPCPPTATPATVVPRGTRSPNQAAAAR